MNSRPRFDEQLFELVLSERRTGPSILLRSGKFIINGMIVLKPGCKVISVYRIFVGRLERRVRRLSPKRKW